MSTGDTWTITKTRFDAHSLGQHNSVFTISNGYLGLKGTLQEDRDGFSPVTLINGLYDELDMFSLIRASNQERRYLDPAHFDTAGRSPAVTNLPNPLAVRVFVGDRELSLTRGTVTNFVQTLDLSCGLYRYAYDFRDGGGRTTRIEMQRFASITNMHRVFMRYSVTPVNHDAEILVLTGISGAVYSNTTRERQFAVTGVDTDARGRCVLRARTPARGIDIAFAVANTCPRGAKPAAIRGLTEHDAVHTLYEFEGRAGESSIIDRFVVLTSSYDHRLGAAVNLDDELDAAAGQGFDAALEEQRRAWAALWDRADVRIDGDDAAQRYLRFCLYHVLAAAPRHTDRLGVPVKLLSGEYYQGNTFYDTDVYILPFYTLTVPPFARACLNWRHIGLGPGRAIAADLGFRGAKLAWQAGPEGEECLGKWWRFTHTNIHINSDAAYALMQYYQATGDDAFLREQGVDLLVETARFFASRAVYDPERDAYDLRDVAGPDEGHCESTNNFYTNYLAIRNLRWAAKMLDHLRTGAPDAHARAVRRLSLSADEPSGWLRVADRLTLLFDPKTRVYEQCEGFYRLKPLPERFGRDRKLWFETVFPYQVLNQPDVVMALVMFRDDFPPDVQRANWEFYKDKSMNFSSMSFVLNAIMAADMGEMDEAYENFLISAGMDVDEELTGRKDTFAGLHGTAAGGAWMAAVLGFGGVCLSDAGLRIRPNLPPNWTGLHFGLTYQGQLLRVSIDEHEVRVAASDEPVAEIRLTVSGQTMTLAPGQSVRIPRESARRS